MTKNWAFSRLMFLMTLFCQLELKRMVVEVNSYHPCLETPLEQINVFYRLSGFA